MNNEMMKTMINVVPVLLLLFCSFAGRAAERDYYQLKIYWIGDETQEARLDRYFEDAYIPALHRAGIGKVGIFKPIEGKNEGKKFIVVFVPFGSLQQFDELPRLLNNDKKYLESGSDYIGAAFDHPCYDRIETILLRAMSCMPQPGMPVDGGLKSNRVYELRSYEAATELLCERKVEMFNQGEGDLFVRLGFNPLFFGEVLLSSHMPHVMYMTTFLDEKSQESHWAAFREHPDWLAMKELERYQNTVSAITRYLLYPAEYSEF
jgi:hypothetical protein